MKKEQQEHSLERRTLVYRSGSRSFLYKGASKAMIATACQSLYPNEHFKLYGEGGGEVYDSRKK
jgi:hypothetical protein